MHAERQLAELRKHVLASPLQRIGAGLADLAILLVVDFMLFCLLLGLLSPERASVALPAVVTCVSLSYLIVLWGRGQTPGKWVFGIKVVGPDGQPAGLLRGGLRFAGYVVASLPFKMGLLPILWDPLHRGWHDQIAGTLVVRRDAPPMRFPKPGTEPLTPDDSAAGKIEWRDLRMLPVFALATALLTWPVVARLGTHFPSDGGDANVFVWSLWWVRKALLDPRLSVFETDYIFWPQKVSLRLHSFSLFNCALGVPLQAFLSPTMTYSVLFLLAIWLTAFAAYLLGKYVTGSAAGGLLTGLFFGFCPYMIWHGHGHLDLISSEWAVLYAVLVVVMLKRAQARHALLAGAALALAGLCGWYHLAHMAVFTVAFASAWLVVHRRGIVRRAALVAGSGVLCGALLAAWLVPMVRDFACGGYSHDRRTANRRADLYSLDAASLVLPPPYHPVLGRWTGRVYREGLGPRVGTEQAGYLGWSVLALAVVAAWDGRRRRAHLPWVVVGISGLVLAPGFRLHAFGESGLPVWLLLAAGGPPGSGAGLPVVPSLAMQTAMQAAAGMMDYVRSSQVVDMPYAWLWRAGVVMRLASVPARFVQVANLALAVLAAVGALRAAEVIRARRGEWAGKAALVVIGMVVMFEYLIAPRFPTEPTAMHPFYSRLAHEGDCAAVVDLMPRGLPDTHPQRAQTIHGKRLYGGFISRTPDKAGQFLVEHPLLSNSWRALWLTPYWRLPEVLGSQALHREGASERKRLSRYRADLRALADSGCCYIIVHKEGLAPYLLRRVHNLLGGKLGLPLELEDGELTVYRVREGRGANRTRA